MPIYTYECKNGHRFELFFMSFNSIHNEYKFKASDDEIWCVVCNKIRLDEQRGLLILAEKVYSLPANIKTPEDSKSNFTYYENKKGQVEFTGTPNQWHPKGFVRKTARNLHERLAIEKRIRKQDNERLEKQREQRDIQRHYSTAERHSELRQRLREGQIPITNPETGNKENVVLDERSKSIINKGMEYTSKKKIKKIDSEFHFSENHDDKSNVRGNE